MVSLLFITMISLTLAGSAYSQVTQAPFQVTVKIFADPGANVTLPCRHLTSDSTSFGTRVKWYKVADDEALNEDVISSLGIHTISYGSFKNRVFLQETNDTDDASLTITDVSKNDTGKYRCEITNGMDDVLQEVTLEVADEGLPTGVVFPYSPSKTRYSLNFNDAVLACQGQGAVVATFDQLFEAWKGGLDWCNAGWLNDSTVQYPISKPREACGGANNKPRLVSYGRRDKHRELYDVFCFATALTGRFYWLNQPDRLTYDEAVQACLDDNAQIAKVGQMYAAWKFAGYNRCDGGWLADGSVRYPISRPSKNCSPTGPAVRFIDFPDKTQKSYGVYCYK
ncbi:hyaluronan and proteoglycan link protein 1-like [Gouania willdenowi]|uniref:Hyaluronan and proteoglycan link protein 1-like n=1 Tax=Gouania willdenowi TaxID=441366 RepID=A0A8C5I6I2_GOUWI|nr:hyaluronan and proteoglycan link protein 1-like [Gouania willdenowi]